MALLQGGRQIRVICGGRAAVRAGRMSLSFEELDFRPTPMGVLSLRRRRRPMSDVDVYEIKLGDEFLMSSQFTAAEIELARLGLAALGRADLDVVVGGLGLGYTARAVLENPAVRSLIVVDALAEVIEWHEQGLLPLGKGADRRSALPSCQRRLLRDVVLRRRVRSSFAGPAFRCRAGGHRSLAAQAAASAPRRAVRAGGAGAACRSSAIRAACSRCGRTIRRMMRSSVSWPTSLQPEHPMS